ncbi:VCBS domain-containing protein, partial [Alcaligenaceae bacterium B3P038]|nr:VCBS domain-containing protein [Alcaligenaceae bacterium B3P038]
QGEQRQEVFTVTSADGTVSQVTVTVIGTNDAAVIAGQGTGTVTEDQITTASGTLTVTDVDAGQATFTAQTATAGTYGSFSIGTDGAWTYTLNNTSANVQALAQGEQRQEIFTVTSADGTVSQVTVTVVGTNDAAVIVGQSSGAVTEDQITTASGTLTVTDADAGQATFTAQTATAGTYGSFSIGTDGAWTYALNNAAANVQALAQGEQRQEIFTVTSADGTISQVTVTVIGTNDAAVIAGQGTGTVTEDQVTTASGTLTVTDADAGQATFTAQTGTAGTYGAFSIGTDGAWTYTLNNAAANVQALAQGEQRQEIFTVTSADGTVSQVTVTVIGTNDAAVIAGQGTGTVTEDQINTASGTLTVTDADAGQATFTAQAGTAGTYGLFSIGTDGAWTYTLNNTAANVQALAQGEQRQEVFTVTSADGTVSQVTVTVIGTNDAAVIAGQGTGTVTEDQTTTASGTLTVTDADADQATFTAQTATAGAYGSFSIGTDGAWTYTLNNAAANVQALAQGEQRQEVFTVTSVDGTVSQVTVTVIGTNDAAVIAGQGSGTVTEDQTTTASGTLTVTDADAGQATFTAQAGTAGTYGSFSIGTDGAWTYTLNNAAANVQALAQGEQRQEIFTVTSADGTVSQVTFTVIGTNDAAVIAGQGAGTVTEDSVLTASGTLTVTDADAGQATFTAQAGTAGTYGAFSIGTDGAWTYTLNNTAANVQALAQGEQRQEVFTVTSADGTVSQVTVTVVGTNDAAVIAGQGTGTVTEDQTTTASGTLTVTDADAGQATFTAQTATAGTYGAFSIGTDGAWTYTLNNAAANVQALAQGEQRQEVFTVTSADGTVSQVTVTVIGTNDAAVIAGQGTGTVTEDQITTASGTLTVTDADSGQATFTAQTGTAGTYGAFSIGTDGAWTYTLNNTAANVQALGLGEQRQEVFTVTSADGTVSQVTVTVIGTNDAAVIAGQGTGTVTEDSVLTASGTLTVTDADAGQATFTAQTATAGTYGAFSIGTDGAWTYTLNNAAANVQALAQGEQRQEIFTVTSADGTVSQVTVTVIGTNDAAVIAGQGAGTVTEDSVLTASGTLTVTDADAGQATFTAQAGTAGTYGSFSIGADGAWTYTLNNTAANVQALAQGEQRQEIFTVTSADGTVSQVTVTVIGTNDAAVIAGQGTGTVTEDQTTTASGTLTVTDADAGQATFTAQTGTAGTYGSFSIGTDGAWTYTLNNTAANVQALAQGEQRQEIFTVTSADGSVSQVTVTVIGTNDAAVIAGQGTGTVTEDQTTTASGTLTVTDADVGQATFTAQTGTAGAYGSFSIGTDGAWTYTLNNTAANVQALAQGEQRQEVFTVTSADGTVSQVTVTVIGTNDAAVIAGQGTGTVTEDQITTASGTLTVTDADAGQATFTAQTGTAGTYGAFSIGTDGAWTYTLDNNAANVQALAQGEQRQEIFTVTSADGTVSQVTVTVIGTNDAAVIAGQGTGTVTEDSVLTASGTLTVTDADAGQATFTAQTATAGAYGAFSIGTDGAWTYTLNNTAANVQALAQGDQRQEVFTVTSADGTVSQVTVTVIGTNDAAVIAGQGTGTVNEDQTTTASGTLTVTDADAGQATFTAQTGTAGTYGAFSIGTDGAWTYTLNNAAANVQALAQGEQRQEVFTVTSADGTVSQVTVTVIGTNDAAVIAGQGTGTVTEDQTTTASGTLTVTDADAGQATFTAQTGTAGTYGSFSIGTDGAWTYSLNNAAANVQALAQGEQRQEIFTVTSADGTVSQVTVTVIGTNDAAVIAGQGTGTVTEDRITTASGTLTVTDADAGQATFTAQAGTAGTYGSFSIGTDGAWTYTLNNTAANVQALAQGEQRQEMFTVTSADGTISQVTVTVIGTNDAAVIAGQGTGNVTEDTAVNANGSLVSTGMLTISDADAGQSTFQAGTAVPVGSTLGSLSVSANGAWTYNVANSDVQYLAAGQTKVESFTVSAADGTTTVVTVTITGTNDVPTFAGAATGTVTEDTAVNVDGNLVSSGTLIVTDADAGQSTFQAGTAVPVGSTLGSLSIAANGTWIYNVANNAVQYLAAGETKTESFTVAAADGTTTIVTVTITGTNDVPTFTGVNSGAVTQDNAVSTGGDLVSSGSLVVADADANQSTFNAGPGVPVGSTVGSLSIAENGTWTYNVANSAVQYLAAGETKTESFTVFAADGTTTVVTVTITGTNDVPTFSGTSAGSVTEDNAVNVDGNLVSSGTLTIADADAGQSTFKAGTAVPVGSTLGSLSIAENGTWTYNVANSAVQYLAAGQTKVESFTVSAADGTTTVVTVTITGTNDVPTFSGAATGTVTEDTAVNANGNLVSSGTLTISDADAGQSTFKAGTAVPVGTTLGSLSIAENGTWTYNVANSAVQYLAAGQTRTESFTVSAADGTTTVVTVTITGTNDVPTFTGTATGTVTEDTAVNANGNLVSSGTLTISDADAGQSTFKAGTAVP